MRHLFAGLRSVALRRASLNASALVLASVLVAAPLVAQERMQVAVAPGTPHHFAWVFDGTLEMGGDMLLELTFTDGSKQKIYTGQGGTVSFGAELRPRALPNLGLRALAGIKFTSTAADDANIMFTRVPLEVVASYYLPREWRVGAGLAYHTAVKLNGDGFVSDVNFDPAAGATVELGWKWAAVTYTTMEYTVPAGSLDASAIGLSFSWAFGKRY